MSDAKVLIVEDEAIIALDLKLRLELEGIAVTSIVMNGEKVEESLLRDKPDFIVLDIFLAGRMTGIDVARLVNERYHIPFAFTTGNSDQQTTEAAKKQKPAAYFLKPVHQDDLVNVIRASITPMFD